MDIDLKGKIPKPKTLNEATQLITALWKIVRDLKSKKEPNSKNSSLPPSKDKSSKNKSNVKRNAQRKKNPKKPGGQPGHKKYTRELLSLDKVDHTVSCVPNQQCGCGGAVVMNVDIHRRHQQYEFPIIKPIVTEYQLYSGKCRGCDKKHIAQLPQGVSFSMLGPRATAMTAHLSGTYRISKSNIVNMYQDIFAFKISTGMVCKAEKTVSKALAPSHDEAKKFIQEADKVAVHADETGFKEKGKSMWAWVAITQSVALFIIRKNRSKKVSKELLSENFSGILCSDRYSAYQWVPKTQRQFCWAHLERDFRKISERTGTSQIIGDELLQQTNLLFHFWHQFKDGFINRRNLKRKTASIRQSIQSLLMRGKRSRNLKTAGTCRNILSGSVALWRFLETEGIEPTNNLAERVIRTLAIWRKTSFGTQSSAGTLYMERIISTVATCKLQGKNILDYLTSTVRSYNLKIDPPSLIPQLEKAELSASLAA